MAPSKSTVSTSTSTSTITHLSPIYTLWFLNIEPLGAIAGAYLSVFQPQRMLLGTVPFPALLALSSSTSSNPSLTPASTTPEIELSPLHTFLLTNMAALYLLFAINEGFVLRVSKEKKVWMGIVGAMLVSDIGHLYAVWKISPERMSAFDMGNWTSDEWINYGTLWGGVVLRALFLGGWGWS